MGDEVENSACHDTLRLCLLEEELQLQVSFISAYMLHKLAGEVLSIFQIGTMYL